MSCEFFANRSCEYYPCHDMPGVEEINCLFCFCPLYALGDDCGGNHTYTPEGIKDCSGCLLPHRREGYRYVIEKLGQLCAQMCRDPE